MTAQIGHPTLRLVRVRIKNLLIDGLPPGTIRKLDSKEIDELKK
jgi:16S rRNA U516 pseudouridylate synthase RsuA-like enzyme